MKNVKQQEKSLKTVVVHYKKKISEVNKITDTPRAIINIFFDLKI